MGSVHEGLELSREAIIEEMGLEWTADDTLIQVLSMQGNFAPLK
jgi:hypothetical protein